jgi:uncharacterized phage-like protein YoqJ
MVLRLDDPRIRAADDPVLFAERDLAVAVTGHRPDKIGGYSALDPQRCWIKQQLRAYLLESDPAYTISGMALGVDQDWAQVSVDLGIPFVAAIPFVGQEGKWPTNSRAAYHTLLARAQRIVIVSPGGYASWKMQTRNEWMVDHCGRLVAVWDGTAGGTGNCVAYAQRVARNMHRINPSDWQP